MTSKRNILSSANLLLIFESAGRRLSFTRAAEELGVSQPAVSHAIKNLERQLGVRLFDRQHRGVTLSRAGKTFFHQVSTSLDDIYRAADALKHSYNRNDVTLSVSTAFATHWLMPRIARFKQDYPSINLRCLTTETDTEFSQEDIDLRIPLGGGDWPGYERWHFTEESVIAVCSESYLRQAGRIERPADLLDHSLLHLEASYTQRQDWEGWLKHYDLKVKTGGEQFSFNDYSVVLQAALEGQGIALGWLHIVEPLLTQGRLVQVLPEVRTTNNAFYILAPKNNPLSHAAECLRNWLITEVNSGPLIGHNSRSVASAL
jgi:DNA-binding transcriptional LysR family regulator